MPVRLVSVTAAAAITVSLGVAGCAGQSTDSAKKFTGDQQQVAKVIESLETASVKGRKADGKKICTQLITDALAKTIASQDSKHNCDERIKASMDDLKVSGGAASLDVVKVNVDGDKAVASVKATTGADKQTSNYSLVRSGKTWRISQF